MKQTSDQILFELFGELKEVSRDETSWMPIKEVELQSDKFKIKCIYYKTKICVCVNILSNYYYKYIPINFVLTEKGLSKRKKDRIKQGLTFLLRNKKEAFCGSIPGFDDLSSHVLRYFYKSYET